ncbi:hypothetical protein [Nonomuraea jiangxiensis]|uniref:hypothetical protein n=1 Tax=Nonomuraea jiangxiensis TaxID=633440 RepID=UPI003CCB7459
MDAERILAAASEVSLGREGLSARRPVAAAADGADLGVGDLAVQQRVQLRRLRGDVAEAAADGLDGDAGVDEFGGVGVAQLVDVEVDASGGAVALPAVVGGVVAQRPAGAVDGGAEQRPGADEFSGFAVAAGQIVGSQVARSDS